MEVKCMTESTIPSSKRVATAARPGDVVLATRDLSKRFGERLAVDHLNLEVRRGEVVAFLGPNGAGKTTTIRMLLGLIAPTGGHVELFGSELAGDPAHLLPRVGALIETPALHLYMSGRDNLTAIATVLGGVSDTRLDAVLDLVGLTGRQHDRVRTYSLGMKQRLGVAVALLNDPDLLILDEPANGLDPAGIVEMRDLMRQLAAQGKTVFLSSHVLHEVRQICTRVAIIHLGRLITETTVENLVAGNGEFVVTVERAAEALAAVRGQPWGRAAHVDEAGQLITVAPDGRGRTLVSFLVRAGFVPDAVQPLTRDLEQVFLGLTIGGTGAIQ
jgi:ABC-2 type transport system ATP-binding protein